MDEDERTKKIEEMVEELTAAELTETDLAHKLAELVEEDDIELINELPLLYRMEIKKVLQEKDKNRIASQIKA